VLYRISCIVVLPYTSIVTMLVPPGHDCPQVVFNDCVEEIFEHWTLLTMTTTNNVHKQ